METSFSLAANKVLMHTQGKDQVPPWLAQKKSDWKPLVSSVRTIPRPLPMRRHSAPPFRPLLNDLLVVDMLFRGPWAWYFDTVTWNLQCIAEPTASRLRTHCRGFDLVPSTHKAQPSCIWPRESHRARQYVEDNRYSLTYPSERMSVMTVPGR
jgi:hypothetical protein